MIDKNTPPTDKQFDLNSFELVDVIWEKVQAGSIPVNFNGHYAKKQKNPTPLTKVINKTSEQMKDLFMGWGVINFLLWCMEHHPKDYELLIKNVLNGEKFNEPIKYYSNERCYYCGSSIIVEHTGTCVNIIGEKQKDGCCDFNPITTVDVDVPSGILYFQNDLRELSTVNPDYSVNYENGIQKTIIDYAKDGWFYAFTGNTCPGVFQNGNTITIGNPEFNEDTDEEKDQGWGIKKGFVCTDLWWFSAMDEQLIKERCILKNLNPENYIANLQNDCKKVIVDPGKYRLTVDADRGSGYYGKRTIYGIITKI